MSDTIEKPKIDRIAIVGAGGIGSNLSAILFDYGAKRGQFDFGGCDVDIYDCETVDASNLLHQNYIDEDIGKFKVDIVSEKSLGFIKPVNRFMTPKDFKNYDIIFCCVDQMLFRKNLYEYGFEHPELTWFDGRCSSRQIGLYHSKIDRKALEKAINDSEKRTGCLLEYDKKNKTSHVTPQIIAGMLVQTFLNYIRNDIQLDPIVIMI